MKDIHFPTTAAELGRFLNGRLLGDPEAVIESVTSVSNSKQGTLSFFSDKRYQSELLKVTGGVVLTTKELVQENLPLTFILVDEPKKAFARVGMRFKPHVPWRGISDLAYIEEGAKIHPTASIGPFATVTKEAVVGAHSVLFPHVYVGPNCFVGEDCEIHHGVTLVTQVKIGNRVKIFAGSVLSSEGFGFLEGTSGFTEMPQLGWVLVEDDVRIGAKCTIDRSALGETRIGQGSKLDDQVHIGHNCIIGKNCILCGQATLAGSTVLEDDVILGGQVGLGGHLTVGKGARLGGQSGTSTNLKGGESYFMSPAMTIREAMRTFKAMKKLPQLFERVRNLEKGKTDAV